MYFHELSAVESFVYVAVVASGVASVLVSSVAAAASGSTFSAFVSVLTRSDGLPPGLYIETLSFECTLIPKET